MEAPSLPPGHSFGTLQVVLEMLEPQPPLVVQIEMDDEQFFRFCQLNRDKRIERSAKGEIIIMTPEGGSSGRGSSKLTAVFENWGSEDNSGEVFGSSTGFILPNKAVRAPDVAWVRKERLDRLSAKQWQKFLPLCPDFVLELRSPSDSLKALQDKMEEYIQNGAQLGWLIDPQTKQVHIYEPSRSPLILDNPSQVSGEPLLHGFLLDLPKLWAAMRLS